MKILPAIQKNKKEILILIGLFIAAFIFVTLNSTSTSPLYPFYFGSDSAQFQTVGMAWAHGRIPYRDIFDHKGPMAFFFDMLSYKMFGTNFGLYLVQIVFMFINFWMAYLISKLYVDGLFRNIVSVALVFVLFAALYLGGNLGEEYCLPFTFVSTYLQLRFLHGKEEEHTPIWALIYGVAFGVCFFSKATNALCLGAGVLVIVILLLQKRKYVNLLKNGIAFIVGFLIVAIPFSVYFAVNGCFSDMMFAMIEFNVSYQKVMHSWVTESTGDSWYTFMIYYFPYYCAVFSALINVKNKKWDMFAYNILILIIGGYFFFDGTLGYQYMFMVIPNLSILSGEIFGLSKDDEDERMVQIVAVALICALCWNLLPSVVRYPIDMRRQQTGKPEMAYDQLLQMVPFEERDSFVAYGASSMKDIYLQNGIVPSCKYFVLQSWHACFNEKTYQDIQDTFATSDTTWILTDNGDGVIEDTLNMRYYVVGEVEGYTLYHIID